MLSEIRSFYQAIPTVRSPVSETAFSLPDFLANFLKDLFYCTSFTGFYARYNGCFSTFFPPSGKPRLVSVCAGPVGGLVLRFLLFLRTTYPLFFFC